MSHFLFKDRDGQTPLPAELRKGLKIKNIQSMGELDEHEEENITEGLVWLEKRNESHVRYNFWLKLHKRLFNKVWTWAGAVRTHELNNPDFLQPHQIWPALKQLEDDLAYWIEHQTYPKEELAARFHERIETIHPFANGNGRFGRIIIEHFCRKEALEIPTWGQRLNADPKARRKAYIDALDTARKKKDFKPLLEFMFS